MKSERETLEWLSVASKVQMSAEKQQEIWNHIEQEMGEVRPEERPGERAEVRPLNSRKRRSNVIGTSAAAVAAVAIVTGAVFTVSHHRPGSSATEKSRPNDNKDTSTAQYRPITMDDINRYYAEQHLQIVSTRYYPTANAVIVESNVDPTLSNDFDWWDMLTGKHYLLVGRPFYTQFEKLISEDEVLFLATGANVVSSGVEFPHYIDAKRSDPNSPFKPIDRTAFFPVDKSVSFGNHKVEAVSSVTASSDAVTVGFAALHGKQADFSAGTYGAPQTTTGYVSGKNQLVVRFQAAKMTVPVAQLQAVHNEFVQRVSTRMKGSDIEVVLQLSDKAKFYTGKLSHQAEHPSVTFTFASEQP